jgi:hypothetical protein
MKWYPYTFSGASGEKVLVRVRETGGDIYAEMSLRRPNGSQLCHGYHPSEFTKECILDVTGTYTMWMYSYFGMDSGTFDMYLARISSPTTEPPTAIAYGDLVSDSINAMEWYPYTFWGTSGEKVLVRVRETGGDIYAEMSLRRPNGSQLCHGYHPSEFTKECILDVTGTYTMWMYSYFGMDSGTFDMYLARISSPTTEPPTAIAYGDLVSDSINAMEWYPYTFWGTSGEKVLVRVRETGGDIYPAMSLRRPDGSQLCMTYAPTAFTEDCVLDTSGTYTLWIHSYSGDESGTYSMTLASALDEACNRYYYLGSPNPEYPDAIQYICKHDLENNDDQFNEYYTYKAWHMGGHSFQHQDQFRKFDLFPQFYYGLQDPNGYWQFQETTRFDLGDYSWGGYTKTNETAIHHPNGAWQHEYEWRDTWDGYLNYCYAQSDYDENGNYRYPSYFCNFEWGQESGDLSPVPLVNPTFKYHGSYR